MADVYPDLGAWALARLKAATAVTALVVGGAANVVEAGDLTAETLTEAQETRRAAGETGQVLAVVVQDLGEKNFTAACAVFIYDRYGYANIRAVREASITALVNQPALLVRDAWLGDATLVEFNFSATPLDSDTPKMKVVHWVALTGAATDVTASVTLSDTSVEFTVAPAEDDLIFAFYPSAEG